ncbi:MAG: MBOAT family protein [Sedimentisphaerales bacterium]|nr:MBOAT family protein [Sedimentisphaerales bacterium]
MLFNSLDFVLFIVLFFCLWPLLRQRKNLRWGYLVVASSVFYGWWDWRFLFLILASGLIDFLAALIMVRFHRLRRVMLIGSIVGNIGSLAVFKYLDFCIGNVNWLFEACGIDCNVHHVGLLLPIGISFYTFQSLSYTVDVYRGQLKPTRNPLHFFAYLAMFPQLVAGPIVRAKDLLPQLENAHNTTEQQRWDALRLIAWGYFKKMVIADSLAPIVNLAFSANTLSPISAYWWMIITMFALQIYCDFSGYSDIARGLAKWMGYDFPVNFNHPYLARSLRDFWGRWHISLSTWFQDYVYIPLGGSRCRRGRAEWNMWITMLLSGLWHGAAWNFLIWGGWHAAILSLERLTDWPQKLGNLRFGKHIAAVLVFGLVLIGWVFFRAESFGQAVTILRTMFSFTAGQSNWVAEQLGAKSLLCMAIMIISELYFYVGLDRLPWDGIRLPRSGIRISRIAQPIAVAFILTMCVFMRGPGSTFIYFRF